MSRVLIPTTDLAPTKATLTTALAGANDDLTYTAKTGGPSGNSLRVQYVVAGASTPLSIVVRGFDIIVNVATSGASAATSTAAQVKAALEANADAMRLVTVTYPAGNDGTGVVSALAATALAGGGLSVTPPAQVDGDAVNGHYVTLNNGETVIEVVSSDASARTVAVSYSPHYSPLVKIADESVSIPAGATRWLGPFLPSAFNMNGTGDVYVTPSVATTLKFRAYKVVRAA